MNPKVRRDELQGWKRCGDLSAEAPLRPGYQLSLEWGGGAVYSVFFLNLQLDKS